MEPDALRASVREKYRHVALQPLGAFHFHTGRPLAVRLGYDPTLVAGLPDRAVESFAGVANPFSHRPLCQGDRVVDVGSRGVSTRSWPRTWWAATAGSSAWT